MAGLKALNINTPPEAEPHIYAEDDATIYKAVFGGDGVSTIGQACKATVLSNNKVRIADGVLCVDGHMARIPYGEYEDCEIMNGQSGKNRNDIIVAKFETTGTGGIDTMTCEVIQGTAGETAVDPELTQDDIYAGGKVREYPLYRVKIDGLSITAVEQMFKIIPSNKDLSNQLAEISKKMAGKYAYAYSAYLDNEKSTKTSLTLNSIKATGHGRKCILMCFGAMRVTTLTARLSVYVNGKESCSGITSSTSYVPVFDSNIITLPEGENTIEIRLSAQANTATAYIGRYHKLGFIVAEL
ncbi:MAG: hypothetical protein ACLVIS_08825 [Dorea longicatena]